MVYLIVNPLSTYQYAQFKKINSQNNNNTFQAFSKTYMRLVKEMKTGKEFKVAPIEESDAFKPVDINLLEKLRKKYDL